MARELPTGIEWPRYEDGGLVEIGDTVPVCDKYEELLQVHLGLRAFSLYTETCDEEHQYGYRLERTVLAADGVPIKVGDTVYFTDGREQECNTVVKAKYDYKGEPYVQLGSLNGAGHPTYTNCSCIDPSQLTHAKPEQDSWERIEEDAGCTATKYNERRGTIFTTKQQVARDLVRRCRALAERERGE